MDWSSCYLNFLYIDTSLKQEARPWGERLFQMFFALDFLYISIVIVLVHSKRYEMTHSNCNCSKAVVLNWTLKFLWSTNFQRLTPSKIIKRQVHYRYFVACGLRLLPRLKSCCIRVGPLNQWGLGESTPPLIQLIQMGLLQSRFTMLK